MHILISNDDGYFAKGLKVLASKLKSDGHRVSVVAPDRNMSGCGQSLSLRKPINVRLIEEDVYSVQGTPADCVYLALHGLIEGDIDLVVSGINDGANLGDDTLYSGTFAAAMEGRRLAFPNIAISIVEHDAKHFETAAMIVSKVIKQLPSFPVKEDVSVLNINVPDVPMSDLKGTKITSLGNRQIAQSPKVEQTLHGGLIYWIGSSGEFNPGKGDEDFIAIKEGYVSVTPLSSKLEHKVFLPEVSNWINDEGLSEKNSSKQQAHKP